MSFILPTLKCFRTRLSVVLLLLPLFGCTEPPAPAACRSKQPPQQVSGTAACLLAADNTVLLLKDQQSLLTLPSLNTTHEPDAQCALHQHIWNTTGINVEVGSALLTTKKGLTIYHCSEAAGLAEITEPFSAPGWTNNDVTWVKRDPFNLTIKAMQNRDHLVPLRDALIKWQQSNAQKNKSDDFCDC